MTNNNQKSVSLVSPPIVTPKIDFKGSIYHFALAKHNQYAENKNRLQKYIKWKMYRWGNFKGRRLFGDKKIYYEQFF